MRHHFHHHPMGRHYFYYRPRPIFRRPYRRRGSLFGMIGLAALGYTLLERNRQNQAQQRVYTNEDLNRDW